MKKNETIECNEIKEDIIIKNKTEIFHINPVVFIAMVKAIKWITLIICIYSFYVYIKESLL